MNDFERISRVIHYLEEHRTEQPELEKLAQQAGLSAAHFHRLFLRWAGITPKAFLQCLTLQHAREMLREGRSVLDSALESGLSGPGRLHDLCLKLEAATPGEVKTGGAGWKITAGYAQTLFGKALIAEGPRGICHLSFGDSEDWDELEVCWPNAEWVRDDRRAGALCRRIFVEGRRPSHSETQRVPLRLFVKGTAFQVKVWQALLQIPEGCLASYGQLAALIGNPKASRAVGTAVGCNPIAYLIPCHRVIRETGAIGGYRWGITRKRAILTTEGPG